MSQKSDAANSAAAAEFASTSNTVADMTSQGDATNEGRPRASLRLKRRRIVPDDEDVCNEELLASGHSTPEAVTQAEDEVQEAPSPTRLVLLSVKTPGSTFTRFAVAENIIRQIPDYSRKLDTAIAQDPYAKRMRITEHKMRREETIIQVIEYLSDGLLQPLDVGDAQNRHDTFVDLIYLYDMGVALSIGKLQHNIVAHIANCDDLATEAFVTFAAECYREGKDSHKITPDCVLGQFIKQYLADNLQTLVESGAVDDIKEIGGTLNKQLLEVFMADYVSKQTAKKAEYKVKIEVED
ncbi:hypothetical protein LTR36_007308 [Oleoguttula mirabilis]|uniref:Uncharacterized protein n=1 Tax=Oleoguttula mirabilis TaxID=1507867 RepID=A0AAV9JA16_9PEZI|nr:hypothetical protein LTR36_007308 [Oleoguttula mirabilis]